MENSLKKYEQSTVGALTIRDCLDQKPLTVALRDRAESQNIFQAIGREIDKMIIVFNWKPVPQWKILFIEAILEKYKAESLNDILICLRNGRNGFYKKPFGVLDPSTFSEWMTEHLEKKYKQVEAVNREMKPEVNDLPEFKNRQEYIDYVKTGFKNQAKIKELKDIPRFMREKKYKKIKDKIDKKLKKQEVDK